CPACGTDGTDAANAALAQTAQPQATAAGAGPLRIAAPVRAEAPAAPASPWTAPRRRVPPQPGQTDRMQAKYEAQTRMSWGGPPREVLIYLMGQGFSREDASDMVEEMFRERQATIRRKGIMNILCGITLICVPLIAFVYFLIVGYILVKSFLFTIAIGLG